MALLNGVRVVLINATPSLLTAGPAILGFNGMVSAGAEDGYTYQWVLEANFNSLGVATVREGGSGVYSSVGGTLARNTIWSTLPGNAQIAITGTTHVIVTPMASQLLANTVTTTAAMYNVTSEEELLVNVPGAATVNLPPCANRQTALVTKDTSGNASINNITLTPFGSEKIDGSSAAVINTNWGFLKIAPFASGGWYTTA